ncbi:hypothetical protein ACN27F_20010 [Solwaraspora sp. WMMB335]|uniref:hypothetical protein n=1 Tax=Solwaraspora sp. WMMB335 TaxID=3404118 RepID=UPI003B9289B5
MEHEATDLALTLVPLFAASHAWSDDHHQEIEAARDRYTGLSIARACFSRQPVAYFCDRLSCRVHCHGAARVAVAR